jgi:RNA polymerase sigma factor (sigma-70 family)
MSAAPLAALVRRATPGPETVSDAELLNRFTRSADQAAFELLVWRHGGMVWGVCRRMLGPDRAAAEDACQAAFVALATHAARLRDRDALAGWLHRVAVRASLDLIATRRTIHPLSADCPELIDHTLDPLRAASNREVRGLLDDGLNRLPDKLRLPFVLCELEGRSNAEAAAALGCPVGTVESRLTRARRRLRDFLTARGVVPAVAAVALPESARAAMVRAGVPGTAAAAVQALAARAIPRVISAKMRAAVAAGFVLAACAAGLAVATGDQPEPTDVPAKSAKALEAKQPDGEPLPAGAVARLGSPRLRHPSWVKHVCFSPDGKRLASVGYDNAVRVWDGQTGNQLFAVRRPEGQFDRVSFAEGGKVVLAVGIDGKPAGDLWRIDAATGAILAKFPVGYNARFSPDGSRIALPDGSDRKLLVADTATGTVLWSAALEGDERPRGTAFSADGKTVAVSTNGNAIRLFDVATGKPTGVLKEDEARFTSVALSPDCSLVLAIGVLKWPEGHGGGLVAFDRTGGKPLWKARGTFWEEVAFTPDGKRFIRVGGTYTPCTRDPADGLSPGPTGKDGVRFESMVEATCLAVRADGKVVAFGTNNGPVCLYDIATGKPVSPTADPPHEVRSLRFSPDAKTLFGWAADWYTWDVATGKQLQLTNTGWNDGMPLSPDGRYTVGSVWLSGAAPAGSIDNGFRFHLADPATRQIEHGWPRRVHPPRGFEWAEFTPDGQSIVAPIGLGPVGVWDLKTQYGPAGLIGHQSPPQYRAFSADSRVLVTATANDPPEEFPIRVWDLKAGKELARIKPLAGVCALAASGDGRRVAALAHTSTGDKPDPRQMAGVWDVVSGRLVARVPQGGDGGHVALSPDGRLVAVSARGKGTVRVYEVAGGNQRFEFKHAGGITSLAFAPGGHVLAAASLEAPIYLWDLTGDLGGKPPAWDADKVWDELGSKDGTKAFAAIRQLRAKPDKAVALLKEQTKLPAAPEPAALQKLFADLGSEDFPTREKATEQLAAAGESVRSALVAEQARARSPEAARRLADLVGRLDAPSPARWRLVRAVEAVEGIDAWEARELLEHWAGGSCGTVLAAEAKVTLLRRAR